MTGGFRPTENQIADIRVGHQVADHFFEPNIWRLNGAGEPRAAFKACPDQLLDIAWYFIGIGIETNGNGNGREIILPKVA